jgi:hypothetical protein
VSKLIDAGADDRVIDIAGNTAGSAAAGQNNSAILQLLSNRHA